MRLDEAAVVVTGAGSGIGRALAAEFARRGACLLLVGRRERALSAARDAVGRSVATVVAADVTDPAGRRAVVDAAAARFGRIDLLVNNAGVLAVGPFERLGDAEAERLLAVNLTAPALLTRDALPLLRRSKRARVLNVGSVFGEIGHPLFAMYSASKFGLRGLSDALRRELAPFGIGVTYAAPRATRTEAAPAFAPLIEPFGMRLDSAADAARRIVDAVAWNRRQAAPPCPERLFLWAQRLFPAVIDRALAAKAGSRKVRHAAGRLVSGEAPSRNDGSRTVRAGS